MVKKGVVIIDAAINRVIIDGKKKVVGDAVSDIHEVASFVTPVPGGVGPMVVTMLLKNTLLAAQKSQNNT